MVETAAPRSAPRVVAPAGQDCAAASAQIALRVISSTEELDGLGEAWSRLHAACDSTAFQSFEWQRAWWRHFGERNSGLRLHVVVLEENHEIFAIAPFVISSARAFALVGLKQLELLGKGITDYLDLLVRPGQEARACEALTAHLAGSGAFDVIHFFDVPDPSPIRSLLLPALVARGWSQEATVREQCPRTRLLGTWPATLASFEDSHRKRVAYLDRKLKKNFAVEVRRIAGDAELGAALDTFMSMHQRRWTNAGEPGAFAQARAIAFHHEIASAFARRGWLELSFLMLDGKAASANYAFRVGGKLEFYLSGTGDFEAARKFAPGILLHAYCMQQMIADGVTVYDFLRGTERYKYELGAQDVANWSLLSFPPDAALTRSKHRLHLWHRRLGASVKRAMARPGRGG